MGSTVARMFHLSSLLFLLIMSVRPAANAQRAKADSLLDLVRNSGNDTNRVRYMWQLARDIGPFKPDSALQVGQQALYLARQLGYAEGESRSLGILANTLIKIGNYNRALELNLEKLQLEEKRSNPRNMASVLMNIGIVYILQEEYDNALSYLSKADSLIRQFDIADLRYYAALNTGDTYNRMNNSDSAYAYFSKSLIEARRMNDGDLVGTSLTGLGHTYRKLGMLPLSLSSYREGIRYLLEAQDDEVYCEATLGMASLWQLMKQYDSAAWYANRSMDMARQDGFLSKELEAARFLADHYKQRSRTDSAFRYLDYVQTLNDSINSKEKIRDMQVISSNEQLRQLEMEEARRKSAEERSQQLQLLLIAIFIPGFFILTLLLSRINLGVKLVRVLGILSLLFLFEYLTLLLHPTVARLTHHTPIYEILIFVGIAAILIPMHHRLEHWLIHHLLHHRHAHLKKKAAAPPDDQA